jgi:DNA invertase Pin-like site-specific DNA recombinase
MKIGYARVSTTGQSLEAQLAALQAEGCEEIFQEKLSGKSADTRKQLKAALVMCRKGDILISTKVDRLARSMTDLWDIVSTLEGKKAALKILDQPLIDTTRPEGKVVVTLFSYVAETERQLILERTAQGRERAKAKGVRFGRKATLTPKQLQSLQKDAQGWEGSMAELGKKYQLSRSSVYRLLSPVIDRSEEAAGTS